MCEKLVTAAEETESLERWVADLQSGMYINCVYCGHQYGPREDVPVAMADVLKEHIEKCPKHPLSKAKAEIERLRALVADAIRNGLTIESCDRCGAGVLSVPRHEHPEGILWCVKCAEIEAGGEG